MFTWCELRLTAPPDVSAADGVHRVTFPARGEDRRLDPVLRIGGESVATIAVSVVFTGEILSLAAGAGGPNISVFPDGRVLFRSNDTMFQMSPARRGAQLVHGETSVTISTEGHVIVVGPDVSVVIDAQGNVLRSGDPGAGAGASDGPGGIPRGEDRIIPFPGRGDAP